MHKSQENTGYMKFSCGRYYPNSVTIPRVQLFRFYQLPVSSYLCPVHICGMYYSCCWLEKLLFVNTRASTYDTPFLCEQMFFRSPLVLDSFEFFTLPCPRRDPHLSIYCILKCCRCVYVHVCLFCTPLPVSVCFLLTPFLLILVLRPRYIQHCVIFVLDTPFACFYTYERFSFLSPAKPHNSHLTQSSYLALSIYI